MLDQRFKKRISKIKSANKAFSFVARIKESKMGKDISKTSSPVDLDNLSINTLRFLSIDAIQKANSGHPGLPMGAAAFAYVLWTRFLKHNQTPGDKRLPGHDCERPP